MFSGMPFYLLRKLIDVISPPSPETQNAARTSPPKPAIQSAATPVDSRKRELVVPVQIFVAGEPTGFARKGEDDWKRTLIDNIGPPTMSGAEFGVSLHFGVSSLIVNGQPFDLDNMCEPVFSILVNTCG